MSEFITEHKLFDRQSIRPFGNPFTGQLASNEQTHDLLNFHEIGEEARQQYIKHQILKQSSYHSQKEITDISKSSTKKEE